MLSGIVYVYEMCECCGQIVELNFAICEEDLMSSFMEVSRLTK